MDTTASARDVYLDLDRLIRNCGLSEVQMGIVLKVQRGYSPSDIAEMEGCKAGTVHKHLNRAVEKIVEENDKSWRSLYGKKFV